MATTHKMWKSFDFGIESEVKSKLLIKNRKANVSSTKVANKVVNRKCIDFHNEMIPKSVGDLAVHSKKVQEVEKWLTSNVLNKETVKGSFLLLSGPTGCGKTATLNVLCKKLGIQISEWINPVDQGYEVLKTINQVRRFTEFLTDSKWNSLFDADDVNRITLVKDFPNIVAHRPEEFCNILSECHGKLKYPVVFISTDTNNNAINFTRTLFTDDIMLKYDITQISFNVCATSLMKKAMKRAIQLIQHDINIPGPSHSSIVDSIVTTAMGDIRCAMNQLYVLCVLGPAYKEYEVTTNLNFKRHRGNSNPITHFMLRDEQLGLFHSLGKVLHPKRKVVDTSWRLTCDVQILVDKFSIQPKMFISFLFENYLKYFGSIQDASAAAHVLSLSLGFLDNWDDKQDTVTLGLWISVLGLMVSNEHRISKWNQIRKPVKDSCFNEKMAAGKLDPADNFYYNMINGTTICNKYQVLTE